MYVNFPSNAYFYPPPPHYIIMLRVAGGLGISKDLVFFPDTSLILAFQNHAPSTKLSPSILIYPLQSVLYDCRLTCRFLLARYARFAVHLVKPGWVLHVAVRKYRTIMKFRVCIHVHVSQKLNMLSSSNVQLSLFRVQRYLPKVRGFW